MYILLTDHTESRNESVMRNARERIFFSLARFGHRINSINVQLFKDNSHGDDQFRCAIQVNIEGSGLINMYRSATSLSAAIELATNAIEPRVAYRVAWRSWFNVDTFSTWMVSVGQPLRSLREHRETKKTRRIICFNCCFNYQKTIGNPQ